jgi:hypothetical protein
MNVADQLHRAALLYADREAVRCGDEVLTFHVAGELDSLH